MSHKVGHMVLKKEVMKCRPIGKEKRILLLFPTDTDEQTWSSLSNDSQELNRHQEQNKSMQKTSGLSLSFSSSRLKMEKHRDLD